jgi:sulfide:quinone oxidoreductase
VATKIEDSDVLIIGGGAAGLSVAARLRRIAPQLGVSVLEPSQQHFYQPLWTLVGAGVLPKERTMRTQGSVVPRGVHWIQEAATELDPDNDQIVTAGGRRLHYRFLVVAPGIQIDWDSIPGLSEGIASGPVASNWSYETVGKTWELIRGFKGGTALFTLPATPIKCPGAAQKIMYLADDHFRRTGVRNRAQIIFASAAGGIFGVPKYARTLNAVLARKGIETLFRHNLVEVRPEKQEAVVENLDSGEHRTIHFDLLHVAPPQSAPDFVKRSPVAGAGGWVELHKNTLQHVRWPTVFGLGDASDLPTAKTGAAVRHQALVVAANVAAAAASRELPARYDGYTACPVVTGYGRLVMAEFDYELRPRESFPFDQSKERFSMYLVKRYGLPLLYWQGMLRGRALGAERTILSHSKPALASSAGIAVGPEEAPQEGKG